MQGLCDLVCGGGVDHVGGGGVSHVRGMGCGRTENVVWEEVDRMWSYCLG
jgi:hypothetical protein